MRGWGPFIIRSYSRGSSIYQHLEEYCVHLFTMIDCTVGGGLSGGKEQHLDTRNIVGDTVDSNTTDKQTHNISLQIFFKTSKYFFRPGSSLTWRPDDLAAQLGQAAGAGHGGNPGAGGGHLNLNMTASRHVAAWDTRHVTRDTRPLVHVWLSE